MTSITASAPGKVVLLGEYAVLEGAPALVAGIDARARVRLTPAESFSLSSSLFQGRHDFQWQPGSAPRWTTQLPAALTDWLGQLLHTLGESLGVPATPQHLALDTSDFFSGPDKLGLGSSAALAVALHAALARCAGQPLTPDTAFASHRQLQGGQGSGIDVATALQGGVLGFQRVSQLAPRTTRYDWPQDLALLVVFVGHSTATGSAIQRYRAWRRSGGPASDEIWQQLSGIAADGEKSLKSGDCAGVMAAMAEYGAALRRLGEAAGLDIVSPVHQQLGQQVAAFGPAVYKPSGAGGGDVGVAVCARDDQAALREHLRRGGCRVLDLSIDQQGLEFE